MIWQDHVTNSAKENCVDSSLSLKQNIDKVRCATFERWRSSTQFDELVQRKFWDSRAWQSVLKSSQNGQNLEVGMMRIQVQEAKAKLSEMLERAVLGENIIITKHGKDTAVILSMESYQRLEAQPNISTWQALREEDNLLDNKDAEELFARDTRPFQARVTFEELE
jgi:prevent-host-death family protein